MNREINQREIKFRAFDGEEMIFLDNAGLQYFDFEGSYALSFVVDGYSEFWGHEQYEGATKKAAKFPIMQFTGLQDKNKKDIYEGDIVEYVIPNDFITKHKSVIKYGNDGRIYPIHVTGIDFEVIGNQYESPELIKQ